jgi:hypothetical protein
VRTVSLSNSVSSRRPYPPDSFRVERRHSCLCAPHSPAGVSRGEPKGPLAWRMEAQFQMSIIRGGHASCYRERPGGARHGRSAIQPGRVLIACCQRQGGPGRCGEGLLEGGGPPSWAHDHQGCLVRRKALGSRRGGLGARGRHLAHVAGPVRRRGRARRFALG